MYKDFDAYFQEVDEKKETKKIKLFNKDYTLPTSVPASIMLKMLEAMKKGEAQISEEKQLELAFSLLGEDNVREWCEKGLTVDQLTELIIYVSNNTAGELQNSVNNSNKKK